MCISQDQLSRKKFERVGIMIRIYYNKVQYDKCKRYSFLTYIDIFLDFRVETFKTEMVDLLSMSSNRLRYLG